MAELLMLFKLLGYQGKQANAYCWSNENSSVPKNLALLDVFGNHTAKTLLPELHTAVTIQLAGQTPPLCHLRTGRRALQEATGRGAIPLTGAAARSFSPCVRKRISQSLKLSGAFAHPGRGSAGVFQGSRRVPAGRPERGLAPDPCGPRPPHAGRAGVHRRAGAAGLRARWIVFLGPTFTCGGVVSGESGFIGSEGFPGVYPPNSKCTWKITVPEGKVVVLSFRYLDLESDNLCRYDFVDIYNGHANGQRIGRFCGTVKPGALVSNSNKMLVQMTSDANTAGSGFIAKFSAAEPHERGDQYCGGRLEKPSGSFQTPNWPERDYPAGVTCSWHIVAPKNQLIELKFEKFDVERDNYCRYDYVAVFNGGEINDAKRIGKYCGDSPPAPILSERNELLIQFLSDLSLTADGFIGHYKFRPKKLPTTTVPPSTTTVPATSIVKPTVALCQQKCKRSGTLESNYCSSNFVITGTVITAITRAGSLHATISIINVYKEGNLAIQQAGKSMSAKIIVVCKQCPLIRRGLNYIIMGQVEEDGRGKVFPNSFVMSFKTKNSKILNALKNKTC
ncbi:PREDICTED: procollagen C-endopeptidase enhancer 2 [Nipponia nippon]|uniref:procollagen C-endopeptidase enhancer 2 n=1 Tax=Nipponia nippon TaxID=128390 RepID=UPI0005118A7D|nr:PREDICTED: procollagen C-endopeptidase enhancer 2 [Nipponia nippon]